VTTNQQQLDRLDPGAVGVFAAFVLASLIAAVYFAYLAGGALALGLPAAG